MDLLNVIRSSAGNRKDDDATDRLNHIYTSMLLILFAVVVTTKQYVGEPIECWCPAQFTGNYIRYTSNICWVKNTYYISMDEMVPETNSLKDKPQLRYYQWMPFILLGLALFYQLPCLFWRANNESSGMNLDNIINISIQYIDAGNMDTKDNCVKMLTKHFDRYLEMRKRWNRPNTRRVDFVKEIMRAACVCTGRKYGNYITLLYVTTKSMYLLNTVAQFILIDMLLSNGVVNGYGIRLVQNFINGESFKGSYYFPRITLCDFNVREMGYEVIGHRYTVQCVLSINLFSEAIFAFYWFWLIMAVCFNAFSLCKWVWYSLFKSDSINYIRKHIRDELIDEGDMYSTLRDFVLNYLRSDGVFAMRLISHNSTDIVVTDLVSAMYENFKIRKSALEPSDTGVPYEKNILLN
ncbi:innexin unc-9-like [Octopus sinensis]|uniref:Innexin n=1 Tax=Octopus sinensis TaxID=2607531 RepID=A0A6P7U9N6_9MOLL|nr:innexin unc-9-like [Octopus sinensis]